MLHPSQALIRLSVLLLTVGAISKPALEPFRLNLALAQTPTPNATFPLPASLPSDAVVRVDGSSSMAVANEALKQRFLEKFPGATLNVAENGSDAAIQAVLDGDVNLAAIGRPLTAEEKAQGLVFVPISREKIAILVGTANSFDGNLTFEQFARMFRGEITDWSEVGGPAGPVRFIDRPETSDTRRSLATYDVFEAAPFENGDTTTRVAEDTTDAVVSELGTDGIGYAIADQAIDRPGVRVLEMHGTLPDDPRYPYSQPRGYVYKEGLTDPATLAFLGFATSEPGQEVIQLASPSPAVTASPDPSPAVTATPAPSPAVTASPSPVATATPAPPPVDTAAAPVATDTDKRGFPWWLLLLGLPLLAGLLWWLMRGGRGGAVAPTVAPAPPPPAPLPVAAPVPVARTYDSRIILTPRDCRHAYAYWEVADAHKTELKRQGGKQLALRLYDVTGVELDRLAPEVVQEHLVKEMPIDEGECDRPLPIDRDDRDYLVDLGYRTERGDWLRLARSEHVRVPACAPAEGDGSNRGGLTVAGGAAAVGAGLAAGAALLSPKESITPAQVPPPVHPGSRIILTPRSPQEVYAYWEASDPDKAALRQQGGRKMMLRLYDVTDIDMDKQYPHSIQQFDINESDQDKHMPIAASDRDYIAEVGYVTEEGRWLKLARSNHVRVPSTMDLGNGGAIAGRVAALAGAGLVAQPLGAERPGEAVEIGNRVAVVAPVVPASGNCAIQHLTVHSRKHCYVLNGEQMQQLEHHTAVTKHLERGSYLIRIKQGVFGYGAGAETKGEPVVLLWIHGGLFVNQKTNVAVNSTWSTLNGYDETLCLEVLEPATLHAFFFDTYAHDNNAEMTVSVIQYATPE